MSSFISGRIDAIIEKAEPQGLGPLRFNAATPRAEDKDVTANRHSIADFNQPQQFKSGVSKEADMTHDQGVSIDDLKQKIIANKHVFNSKNAENQQLKEGFVELKTLSDALQKRAKERAELAR